MSPARLTFGVRVDFSAGTPAEKSTLTPKALADPSRREILRLLRDAGLILAERNGQQITYELNTTVLDELVSYLLDWTRPSRPSRPTEQSGGKHA